MESITIGIQPDVHGNESYSQKWIHYFTEKRNDVEIEEINLYSEEWFSHISNCDGVMWRFLHTPSEKQFAKTILPYIEKELSISVFPNFVTSHHFDEKILQHYLLRMMKAPLPKTWIFWNCDQAMCWINEFREYPLIFKLSSGAGSANVIKIRDREQAKKIIELAFKQGFFPYKVNDIYKKNISIKKGIKEALQRFIDSFEFLVFDKYPKLPRDWWRPEFGYVYFQEFLESKFDTRVTIIGERAFAFRRFNRPSDFRASGSGLLDYEVGKINLECVKIAFKISEIARFQSMAYDFLLQNDKPMITEISYTFSDEAVYKCAGYWDSEFKWYEGNLWPEYAQAEDFVNSIYAKKVA